MSTVSLTWTFLEPYIVMRKLQTNIFNLAFDSFGWWRLFSCYFAHAAILSTWPDVTQVFGTIHLNPHSSINRHNNFRTFPQSLTLLFRYTRASDSLDTLRFYTFWCSHPKLLSYICPSFTFYNHPTLKLQGTYRPDFVLCNLSDFDGQAKSFLYICNWEKSPREISCLLFHASFSWRSWHLLFVCVSCVMSRRFWVCRSHLTFCTEKIIIDDRPLVSFDWPTFFNCHNRRASKFKIKIMTISSTMSDFVYITDD